MKIYYIFGVSVLSALLIIFGVFYFYWPSYNSSHRVIIETPNGPMGFSNSYGLPIFTIDGQTKYEIKNGKVLRTELAESYISEFWKSISDSGNTFDTTLLRHEIDSLFPGDSLLKTFGSGMQTWYVILLGNSLRYYAADLSMFNSGMLRIESIGTDQVEYGKGSLLKSIGIRKKLIKKANSRRVFLIRKGVAADGRVTYPTEISDVNMLHYRPVINKNYRNENLRFDYFFTSIIGGYEQLAKRIEYPEDAKRNGITGRVIIRVYLDENGYVKGTQLLKAIGYGCDESAIKAIKQVRFHPTPDKKVNVWVVPIDFKLEYQNEGFDLAARFIQYDQSKKMLVFTYVNEGTQPVPSSQYLISAYVDDRLVFGSTINHTLTPGKVGQFYVQYKDDGKEHVFSMFVDPDNTLQERNRENNFYKMKGSLK